MDDAVFKSPIGGLDKFHHTNYSSHKKSSKRFLAIIVFLIGLSIFVASRFIGSATPEEVKAPVITPTPTEVLFPTDTPTPSPSISPTPSLEPTKSPIDSKTKLDRSQLTVEVQNGSGIVGAASKASDLLKSFGYKVINVKNADNYDYENVTILLRTTKNAYGSLLKSDVSAIYTVSTISASLTGSPSADAIFIVGK